MRKRRRFVNNMKICVGAVLLAVSTFFYAPMEVSAEEVINLTDSQVIVSDEVMTVEELASLGVDVSGSSSSSDFVQTSGQYIVSRFNVSFGDVVLVESGLVSDSLYEITLTTSLISQSSQVVNFAIPFLVLGDFQIWDSFTTQQINDTSTKTYIMKGSQLMSGMPLDFYSVIYKGSKITTTVNCDVSINVDSCVELSNASSDDYQNGYNAGYSAGESAGYGNGYSQGFTDGEASVDTDAIYDEAFQAGADSVDTQSYYDAGYQAGYDTGYEEAYDIAYENGYQSAMDRIASWGADATEYPKLINSGTFNDIRLDAAFVSENTALVYDDYMLKFTNNFNPFHVYKLVVNVSDVNFFNGPLGDYEEDYVPNYIGYLTVLLGSNTYKLDTSDTWLAEFFIPGEQMSNLFTLRANWNTGVWHDSDNGTYPLGYAYCEFSELVVELYDMGPSGDTQNHIANQTDQLTNGYDDSKGNTVNSELSTGLNEFETAENSLFATATTGMKDFVFFDFESVPAMITGMSFIGSIMGSWFNQAGGASGVGIVLSILFSVILVAMVLGLYRWYQSRGGKN